MPKPPSPEGKYFGNIDVHKMRRLAEEKRRKMKSEERAQLRELHWRRCGNCGMELTEIVFKRETVFKCFDCGAVMLLDKTLEKLCGEERKIIESLLDLFRS